MILILTKLQDELYAIEEEKLSRPHEHIDLSFKVIKPSVEDGVRRINVAEAMPKNPKINEAKRKSRTSLKMDAAKVSSPDLSWIISSDGKVTFDSADDATTE